MKRGDHRVVGRRWQLLLLQYLQLHFLGLHSELGSIGGAQYIEEKEEGCDVFLKRGNHKMRVWRKTGERGKTDYL
jgi:hypothetical protein